MSYPIEITTKNKTSYLIFGFLMLLGTTLQASIGIDGKHFDDLEKTNPTSYVEKPSPFVPSIALVKTGITFNALGDVGGCDSILFSFEVSNQSTNGEIFENVVLTDPMLGGIIAGPISGDDNNNTFLDPGETWVYQIGYDITQTDIDNGQVVNQANVIADVQGQPGVSVSDLSDNDSILEDDPTVISLSQCQPGISVVKTGMALDATGGLGCDHVQYTFEVKNQSALHDLINVVLNDPLLGGDIAGPSSGDVGNDNVLGPDETWIYTADYIITQSDIDNGQVLNQATASADVQGQPGATVSDLSDDNSHTEDDPTVIGLIHCLPGISVVKTGDAQDATGGAGCDLIQYTFEVVNPSVLHILENVVLTDPLLGGVIAGPDSGDTSNDGFLDPDETWIYTAQYNITQTDINNGQVINQATVSADIQGQPGETVADLSDDNSHLEDDPTVTSLIACQNPSIGLIKESLVIDANMDGCLETVEYTFTITNTGDVDLKEVVLEDDLFGGEIPGPIAGVDENNDGILSVDETWTYVANHPITQQNIDDGFIINQATVNALTLVDVPVQDLSDNDSLFEDEPTRTEIPNDSCTDGGDKIGLIKTGILIDVNGDGCLESILYTFTVTNTGTSDLDAVVLDDPLLGGQISGPVDGTDQNNDGILSIGESWTFEANYPLTQADIDNGSVQNQASVSAEPVGLNNVVSDLSDDNSMVEDDPTEVSIPADACPFVSEGLGLLKQGTLVDTNGDQCFDSVGYSFTVTNMGSVDLDSVVLEDPMLGGALAGPVAGSDIDSDNVLSVGESWTYVSTYNLTQADIDNGMVVNQANVAAEPVGSDTQVTDISDDNDLFEDDPTTITVPADACTDGGNQTGFEIFNGITPNGDGLNDFFQIEGIENYPQNSLKIFNRWGVLVYEMENYGQGNNVFVGISDGRLTIRKNQELPSGTYFYILTITGENPGQAEYTGYIYINRD